MEFGRTSMAAGVQDLFPEGIEVCKSGTALCESIGKWVSQSLEKSYIRENFENRKFSIRDLSALEPGYRCWGVQ